MSAARKGYYAVGCARLLPDAKVLAWDIDPVARANAWNWPRWNGVETRIDLRERFEAVHANAVRDELSKHGRCWPAHGLRGAEGSNLLDPQWRGISGWLDLVLARFIPSRTAEDEASMPGRMDRVERRWRNQSWKFAEGWKSPPPISCCAVWSGEPSPPVAGGGGGEHFSAKWIGWSKMGNQRRRGDSTQVETRRL